MHPRATCPVLTHGCVHIQVLYGTDALKAMFTEVGLGWAVTLSENPIVAKIIDFIYEFLSSNRIQVRGICVLFAVA